MIIVGNIVVRNEKNMNFNTVNTHLHMSDFGTRGVVSGLLSSIGFKDIKMGKSLADVQEALQSDMPDLMVIGSEFPEGDINGIVRNTRHNKIGFNPFMTILTITTNPTTEVVGKAANSGVDDLLVFPLSRETLETKLDNQVEHRKPFVVTSQYIGPDRRHSGSIRGGSMRIKPFHVPNSFRSRVDGTYSESKLKEAISETLQNVNNQRLDRQGVNISWLITRVVSGYKRAIVGDLDSDITGYVDNLIEAGHDIANRIKGTEFEYINHLCISMLAVLGRIRKDKEKANPKDLNLLPELGRAFKIALSSGQGVNIPQEIRDIVN